VLWQNDDGSVAIWEMNGTNVIGTASLGNPGPDWHIFGTGDYNNDGKSDILWQNSKEATVLSAACAPCQSRGGAVSNQLGSR
jgi:hypothetical protein